MGLANFYKCDECSNVMLEMGNPVGACKSELLPLLKADSVDAAVEKHVPVVSYKEGRVFVQVGSQPHPTTEEHHIEWIYVKTTFGGIYCDLNPGDPPEASFALTPDEVEEVYAYCNLHGLWKAKELDLPLGFTENNMACSPEFAAGCIDPAE